MNNQQRAASISAALQSYLLCKADLKRFHRYLLMAAIEEAFKNTDIEPYTSRVKRRCCPHSSDESIHVNFETTMHLANAIASAAQLLPQDLFNNMLMQDMVTV
ncbi:hypothetical protein [Pseudomonas fluorescens]|uniref:hypothetical protein n=1 Tax=Pseudomonas fluorescens TaxID=294 RepID=UPI001242BAC3|nr:hypothetical protein [Pseudomonas fluorescens]VVM95684.1 hypothetical protein PS676_03001 [Pseudomonas fluorescens]